MDLIKNCVTRSRLNNHYDRHISGTLFRIYATEPQLRYIDRVLEGGREKLLGSKRAEMVEIICVDRVSLFKNFLKISRHPIDIKDKIIAGRIGDGNFVYRKGVFMDILIPKSKLKPLTNISISSTPEYGAVTFIKSYLLNKYVNQYGALIFHAGAITSIEYSSSIIFSALNRSTNRGDNSGKTTTVLACCARKDAKFAFSSNDEVILAKHPTSGSIKSLPFPNQITMREETYRALRADRINLSLEKWKGLDKETNQEIVEMAPKSLVESGYKISQLSTSKINWVFLDIGPNIVTCSLSKIENDLAKKLIGEAISERRMNQAINPLFLGEVGSFRKLGPNFYSEKLDVIFNTLTKTGINFWKLRCGVDRSQINEVITGILKNG